jgi:hypothetical protein
MSTKKNQSKKIFFGRVFGTRFAVACHFGSRRGPSAILAVCLSAILADANRLVWVVQPPLGGEFVFPTLVGVMFPE